MLITSNTYEKKKKKVLRQVLPGESQNKLIAHVPRDWPQWSPVLLISDDLWVKWKLQMFQHSPHQAQAASHQHRDVACISAWQGAQRSSRGGSSSSLWLIHWRALRMQGNTRLWFEEVSTRGRWCWFLVSVAFRLCHLLWLSLQPASMCCTHTHTDAVVSYRETAAQEKHSHVNVMYKIFSNGGENKHNTTLFELVASTSTLI